MTQIETTPRPAEPPPPKRMSQVLKDADVVLEARQRVMVEQLEAMRLERGEVMYDATWMPARLARRRYWTDRARAIIGIVEMAVVALLLLGVFMLIKALLQQFAGLTD